MTGPVQPARDPARQPERTAMSWVRTLLVVTLVGLLVGRSAVVLAPPAPAAVPVGAAAVAGWVVALVAGRRRAADLTAPVPPPVGSAVPVVAFVTFGYALVGVALVAAR